MNDERMALDDFAGLWLGVFRQSALPKDAMEVLCILTSAHKSEMITAIQRLGSLRAADAVELVQATTLPKSPPPESSAGSAEHAGDLQLLDLPDLREALQEGPGPSLPIPRMQPEAGRARHQHLADHACRTRLGPILLKNAFHGALVGGYRDFERTDVMQ
eukprot:s6516_g3.t1